MRINHKWKYYGIDYFSLFRFRSHCEYKSYSCMMWYDMHVFIDCHSSERKSERELLSSTECMASIRCSEDDLSDYSFSARIFQKNWPFNRETEGGGHRKKEKRLRDTYKSKTNINKIDVIRFDRIPYWTNHTAISTGIRCQVKHALAPHTHIHRTI